MHRRFDLITSIFLTYDAFHKSGSKCHFNIIVRSTFSALNHTKINSKFVLFEIWPSVYKTMSTFPGSVWFSIWPLKFTIPIFFDMIGCRKCRFFFYLRNVWKSVRNYRGGDRNQIAVCYKQKSQNQQKSNFSPLCQLVPSLLECITHMAFPVVSEADIMKKFWGNSLHWITIMLYPTFWMNGPI